MFFNYIFFSTLIRTQGIKKGTRFIKKYTKKWDLPINNKAGFTDWVVYDKENDEGVFPTEKYFKKYYMDYKWFNIYIKIRHSKRKKIIPLKDLESYLKENNIKVFEWQFMTLWDIDYYKLNKESSDLRYIMFNYFSDKEEIETEYKGKKLEHELKVPHYWN